MGREVFVAGSVQPLAPPGGTRSRRQCAIGLVLIVLSLTQAATAGHAQPAEPWHPEAPAHLRAAFPADPVRDAERLGSVGEGYAVFHTAHYSVVHHVDSKTAAYRAAILEDLYAAFTSYFEGEAPGAGAFLEMRPKAKLAVLYTPTREVFVDSVGLSGIPEAVEGVYLGERRLSVFFEILGRKTARAQTIAIGDERQRLERLRREIAAMPRGARVRLTRDGEPTRMMSRAAALSRLRNEMGDLSRASSEVTFKRGQASLETMTHEGAHHLSFAFGLFALESGAPKWLVEGLATYFEPSANGFLLQTGSPHWARWNQIREARESGERIPLEELLTNDEVMFNLELADLAYHEAWSLVHYLATERRSAFDAYLLAVRDPGANASPAARVALFEKVLGAPLSKIDLDWQSHVKALSVGP
ncbi:MAG: DUF1570 domain-containing protein [Myxococcota bacterium]